MKRRELYIKDTHRGLWYEDGVLTRVLEAGRYIIPRPLHLAFIRWPKVEVVLVDIRERDLTIKGQEILTADKVALRVSIIVQFGSATRARRCMKWPITKSDCIRMCNWRRAVRSRR